MKNFKNISKRLVVKISAVCLACLVLSSCLKTHDDTPATPVALLSVIQASPGQPPLDFTLNGNRVNLTAINYGSGIDYFAALTGTRTAAFVKSGTSTSVFSGTITLNQNFAYTLCLVNKSTTPEFLLLDDAISQPASGNASLRFVNLSPDAPAVDLAVKDGAVLVPNKAFKGYSTFSSIEAKNSYTFEIRKAGTNIVLATIANTVINPGFVYTIYFRGLLDGTDDNKLTAKIIVNANY